MHLFPIQIILPHIHALETTPHLSVCVWCLCVWYMVISHRRGFYCVIISAVTLTSFGCRATADQLHQKEAAGLLHSHNHYLFTLHVTAPAARHSVFFISLNIHAAFPKSTHSMNPCGYYSCCYYDWQQAIVCDALLSVLRSSSLLIYHSCIVVLFTRLYLGCANMPPLHVSHWAWALYEGFVTGGEPYKQEGEDEQRKVHQNLFVSSDRVILDSTVSTFHQELQITREVARGDVHIYCTCVHVCVWVHITHPNHLNYFL